MPRIVPTFIFFMLVIFLVSCVKEDDLNDIKVGDYEAEFALPIFQSTTAIIDILDSIGVDSYSGVTNDGLVAVVYRGSVQDLTSDDLLNGINELPDIPILDSSFRFPLILPNSLRLDYAYFKEGEISFLLNSNFTENVNVTVTIPELQKNGQPFTAQTTIVYSGNSSSSVNFTESLADYEMIPDMDSIEIAYTAILGDGSRVLLPIFPFSTFKLQNVKISFARGFLGSQLYDLERDTIPIDIFTKWIAGEIDFANPSITVFVDNSFGFPVKIEPRILNVQTLSGEIFPLESPILENFNIDYPSFDEVGETKHTIVKFDRNNSNVREIVNKGPTGVDYDLDAITNPDPDNPVEGFITDSSRFRIQVEVELPIHGIINGFTVVDTINLNFNSYDDADEAEFKMVTENEVPLDLVIQAYFLDSEKNIIDSLLTLPEQIVNAAPIDEQGFSSGISTKSSFIPISGQRLENLKRTTRLLLHTGFTSYDQPSGKIVKVLPEQAITIKMGAIIKIKK